MAKMFVHYPGTKEAFINAGIASQYNESIVFIGNGECIYTHGKYYASSSEIQEVINGYSWFSQISDGTNTAKTNAKDGTITFSAMDPASVKVLVDSYGVKFGLNSEFVKAVNETLPARIKAIEDDYLKSADKTELNNAINAVKGDSATDTSDSKTIEGLYKRIDEKTSGIASEGVVNDLNNRVKAIEDAPYATTKNVSDAVAEEKQRAEGQEAAIRGEFAAADTKVKEDILGAVADTDAKTIAALNDKIEDVEGAAKSYSIEKIETGLATNVKEAYKLVDEDGTQAGATINIYKDSSLVKVKLSTVDATWDAGSKDIVNGTGNEALAYAYEDVNGDVQVVTIDVADFLRESEFGNGLEIDKGVVAVKVDATSEDYLSVSSDGVKVSGIDAIKATAEAALTDVNVKYDDGDANTEDSSDFTYSKAGTVVTLTQKHQFADQKHIGTAVIGDAIVEAPSDEDNAVGVNETSIEATDTVKDALAKLLANDMYIIDALTDLKFTHDALGDDYYAHKNYMSWEEL